MDRKEYIALTRFNTTNSLEHLPANKEQNYSQTDKNYRYWYMLIATRTQQKENNTTTEPTCAIGAPAPLPTAAPASGQKHLGVW